MVFKNAVARYKAWKSYRRTVESLQGLSDRELEDLGIVRADIPHVAVRSSL